MLTSEGRNLFYLAEYGVCVKGLFSVNKSPLSTRKLKLFCEIYIVRSFEGS